MPNDPTKIKLEELVKWHKDWESGTQKANEESLLDRAYYDGHQWDEEEAEIFERHAGEVLRLYGY